MRCSRLLVVPDLEFWCGLPRPRHARRVSGDHGEPDLDQWALFALVARLAGLAIQRAALVAGLRDQAQRDPLTELLNRRGFAQHLDRLLEARPAQVGVVLVDLDRFKLINDAHEHAVGDQLLRHIAATLTDLAGAAALVGRLGGDEFVIARPFDNSADVGAFADSIRVGLAETRTFSGALVTVRASVGCAVSDATDLHGGPDVGERLVRDADVALYRAKRDGRNRVRRFDADLRAEVDRRVELEAGLETAIAERRIQVHYQPLVDVESERIIGVEALARWARPGHGLVQPGDFLTIAEDTGQVSEIDRLVLEQARIAVGEWNDARPVDDPLTLWVNVSPRWFADPRLRAELTADSRVPLGVELTEHALSSDPEETAHLLQEVRSAGVEVAVDDFGTGYSSLQYLSQFPVSHLKIDGSFVAGLADDGAWADPIVRAVVTLGHSLGLSVTAEGVETTDVAEAVGELGVDSVQGFSTPVRRLPNS